MVRRDRKASFLDYVKHMRYAVICKTASSENFHGNIGVFTIL